MNKFHKVKSGRRWLGVAALVAGLTAAGAMPGSALAQPTLISSCTSKPYSISSSGFYRVANNLTSAANSDCIDVKASNVTLDLHGFTITGHAVIGDGSSGVNIFPGKQFVVVEGFNAFLSAFDTGLQDQGNYATIEDINGTNNYTNGLWLNDVSYSQLTNLSALTGTPGFNAQKYGVHVTDSYEAGVGDGTVTANSIYGVWIEKSNATRVWNVFSENNTIVNLYIGCDGTGFYPPMGTKCGSGSTNYTGNLIYDNVTENPGAAKAEFGIAVDLNQTGDQIFVNHSFDNNTDDIAAIDDSMCKLNLYFGNFLTNGNPTCVGNP